MPEYLAPGVYVEEVSFRSKSVEGVSTSTAGFVGPARFGPISGHPELLTSQADFERIYGDDADLAFPDALTTPNYLAHAVRAFFAEGGRRLYVMRVFQADDADLDTHHHASAVVAATSSPSGPPITIRARFPGRAGRMAVFFTLKVGHNALSGPPTSRTLTRVREFDLVWAGGGSPVSGVLRVVHRDPASQRLVLGGGGSETQINDPALADVRLLTVVVEVSRPMINAEGLEVLGRRDLLGEFAFDARSTTGLTRTLAANPPTRQLALTLPIALEVGAPTSTPPPPTDQDAIALAEALFSPAVLAAIPADGPGAPFRAMPPIRLAGGDDGQVPVAGTYTGDEVAFSDYQNNPLDLPRNGLLAFQAVEDISIVAAPAASSSNDRVGIQGAIIGHCEYMRYRIAVLDTPANMLPTEALDFRNITSSNHAALYYPWVEVSNAVDGSRLRLPPSGFVAGIYARNDIQRAVFKAPANEVVRSAVDLELRLNRAQQELLNPEGVNCLRYFAGRGFLVWGARTISDDPEWKYVNLRRYFAYLEHSIDKSTQWVVFEVNSRRLWENVRRTIEDFLYNEWKTGALMGDDPKQAYFVRCDLSTMTQNDIDNGRLVCLVGVAAVRPAEFVIFRIGQWTATASR